MGSGRNVIPQSHLLKMVQVPKGARKALLLQSVEAFVEHSQRTLTYEEVRRARRTNRRRVSDFNPSHIITIAITVTIAIAVSLDLTIVIVHS